MELNQNPEVIVEMDPVAAPVVNRPRRPMNNSAPQDALIILSIAILFLGFGLNYKNDCPIDNRIPLLLIITGVLYTINSLATTWPYFDPQADFEFLGIMLVFGYTALWITGICFVWAIGDVNYDDALSKFYCNRYLLRFNYVSIILSMHVIGCACNLADGYKTEAELRRQKRWQTMTKDY